MKNTWTAVPAALTIAAALLPAAATQPPNAVSFACIMSPCGGRGSSLESNNYTLAPGTVALVGGFFSIGDGGGGSFVVLGQQSATLCNTYQVTGSLYASGQVGFNEITFNTQQFASGLVVGELVSGSNTTNTLQIAPGSEIAGITTDPHTGQQTAIALTLPMTGTAQGQQANINVAIAGSNGGTLLLDTTTGAPNCYRKADYRGEPHEWGAYGDGGPPNGHDDTTALQNWLGAYGNISSLAPATAPTNFGPWIATIPANYYVSTGLVCPTNAVLQGPANISAGNVQNIAGVPPVRIVAGASPISAFSGTALLSAGQWCRISGITLDANSQSNTANQLIDVVDIAGPRVAIDSHSLLENGMYGVNCSTHFEGLQMNEAQVWGTASDGLHLPQCSNVRLIGDLVESAGGNGITLGGSDVTLADGIVEGSGSADVSIAGAANVGITGMIFNTGGQKSGQTSYSPNVDIAGAQNVTICRNRITAAGDDAPNAAQVRFGGSIDSLTMCGNTYASGNVSSDANVTPWYVYDTNQSAPPSLTNTHIYETATQAAVSVFSSNAQLALASLVVPQFTQNQIDGLTLSNGSTGSTLSVSPGSAADSTNTTLIQLPQGCQLDLGNKHGAGGLDTGTFQSNTTYYIYAIAPGAAAANPSASCMASASPTLAPLFSIQYFGNTGYVAAVHGGMLAGSQTVYNATSIAGVRANNPLDPGNSYFTSPTTVSGFSANYAVVPPSQPTGTWPIGSTNVTLCNGCNANGIELGMAITDQGNNRCMGSGTYITSIIQSIPVALTVSKMPTDCAATSLRQLSVSGAQQLVMSSNALSTIDQAELDFGIGYYRLIGAVYTTGQTPTLVSFTQDNDTFYVAEPVRDVPNLLVGTNAVTVRLASVPNGIGVKAFGRCVGGAGHIIIYSPSQGAISGASDFSGAPGFDVNSTSTSTAFPFSAWTDTSRSLRAVADSASSLSCMTDGWVLKR